MSQPTPWRNRDIQFVGRPVYHFTSQGGASPAGLRVREITTGRTGTITDGPHCTYGATVKFDAPYSHTHYVNTLLLEFIEDGAVTL